MHGLGEFEALDLPAEAIAQPGIRLFDLVAVLEALVKHAVVITNAVTDDRQPEGGATVEEAGGEATETAVAEARVMLVLIDVFKVEPQSRQRFCRSRPRSRG